MKNPPELKVGARVRVVTEGTFTEVDDDGCVTVGAAGDRYWFTLSDEAVVSVEVLPQPLKVGDVISGSAAYSACPVGTVVVDDCHPVDVNVRTPEGWVDSAGAKFPVLSWDRRVVYLPESE